MILKIQLIGCLAAACAGVASLCACDMKTDTATSTDTGMQMTTQSEKADTANAATEKRKLIIDTDTGADDASALIFAAKQKQAEILGVTTLVGNVDIEQSTRNALAALELIGCDAPVYRGSADTYDGTEKSAFSVFGKDGMGDSDLIHPQKQAAEGDAVDFMIETIEENPGEVEIVALGPATNIAKAIKKAPDTMKHVKRIWSMGSAGLGPGNATPVAEFNVYADAPAYKVLLDSGLPVTVIGLDMCDGDSMWTNEQFDELEKMNATGEFVTQSFGKLRDFYRGNGFESVYNCDSVAMMCVLCPEFVTNTINTHASCITDEGEAYAQVIFYQEGFTYDTMMDDFQYNTILITGVRKSDYFETYKRAIS